MTTNPLLGRDIYLALAAVGWADGQLTQEAADAILRTAAEEGLSLEDLEQIKDAVRTPHDVGVVDRMNMSKADRLYVYAVASWIASLDGHVSPAANDALAKLASALGVPEAPRRHADEIMREIAAQDERPERFDLRALRQTLAERLDAAHKARMAQYSSDGESSG